MSDRENLIFFVNNQKWLDLITNLSVEDICENLDFEESMALAYDLFFEDIQNDQFQKYALSLFFQIRKSFRNQWKSNWKNDAFLGKLCSISWKYEEMYELYKSALDQLEDPPESLLLLLASCNSTPGKPLISDKEAEEYLLKAVNKKHTYEAALMMKALSAERNNQKDEEYWNLKCLELDRDGIHSAVIIPDVLKSQNKG